MGSSEITRSIVRLFSGDQVLGAGFVIAANTVATCAHVIRDADLLADFPLLPGSGTHTAEVLECDEGRDTAILGLPDPPAKAAPAPLRAPEDAGDHRCRAFGFPYDMPNGIWVTGTLLGPDGSGRIQLAVDPDHWRPEPGFSGAPVWDDQQHGVVGVLATVSARHQTVAHLIPVTAFGATPESQPEWETGRQQPSSVTNIVSGHATNIVQADTIHGNIRFD